MSGNPAIGNECGPRKTKNPFFSGYINRETHLGDLKIFRALPIRERRLVGPWCFLDRFGPVSFSEEKPMIVPPHPHIGLQTVSWLMEGEVLHSDSLGCQAIVRPGGVNVMTAGKGIAHAEETPIENTGNLSGVQLWVALPDAFRNIDPSFTNTNQVPTFESKGGIIHLFTGALEDTTSPAPYYSEIIGLEALVHAHQKITIPLQHHFEHAVLLLSGDCAVDEQPMEENVLYYLGACRDRLSLSSRNGSRVLLIGGPPFPEKILMWWNFVARTPEEISQAHSDWEDHRRFGKVSGTRLKRLPAPDLALFARPNPAS